MTTLLWRRFGGRADPAVWEGTAGPDREAAAALAEVGAALGRAELRRALRLVHELGRTVNRRLAAAEPWRQPDQAAHQELTRLLPWLDAIGVAAHPIVPATAGRVRCLLGRAPVPAGWSREPGPPLARSAPAPLLPATR